MKSIWKKAALAVLAGAMAFSFTGCEGEKKAEAPAAKKESKEITVYMGVVEQSAKVVASEFEKDTGIKVNFVRMSGGETLSRIRAEKNNPQASVWYGGSADSFIMAKRKDFWKHTSRPMQKKSNRSLKMQMDTGQAFIRAISALYSTAVILTNISCSRRHHGMIC